MPKELQPRAAVPPWDSMSPGEKQAWLLNRALDCKRDILTMPLPDRNDDGAEATRMRSLILAAALTYDRAAILLFGPFARTNFNPEESARVQLRSAFLAELAALREGEAA